MKIAIMQPYFIPYAGYFRLFCAADLFVVYDCVQFPRRSFVHRNQLHTQTGQLDWLTLPLQKQAMDVRIKDLNFRTESVSDWVLNFKKFPVLACIEKKYPTLYQSLTHIHLSPVNFIVANLREICSILEIPCNIAYSADLNLPESQKGEDRILAIAKHFGASDYVNSPGGRDLYEDKNFSNEGIKLHFLPDFQGKYYSIIQSLADQGPRQVREIVYAQSHI